MKTYRQHRLLITSFATLTAGLLTSLTANAGIIGTIATVPSNHYAGFTFDDTGSFFGTLSGGFYTGGTSPWGGALSLFAQTDGVTGDIAIGTIVDTSPFGGSNVYAFGFPNVQITQPSGNTGQTSLNIAFAIEYQLDALGLPVQPTLYPNFNVNGTIQPGGFANITGTINYFDGALNLLDTVTYSNLWTAPGIFTATSFGTPAGGTTPALAPGTSLIVVGDINFIVDPASINVTSVPAPEPTAGLLSLVSAATLLGHFGSAKAASRASVEDLKGVGGISAEMAQKIYDFFHERRA